jgi:hypothetical protein
LSAQAKEKGLDMVFQENHFQLKGDRFRFFLHLFPERHVFLQNPILHLTGYFVLQRGGDTSRLQKRGKMIVEESGRPCAVARQAISSDRSMGRILPAQ